MNKNVAILRIRTASYMEQGHGHMGIGEVEWYRIREQGCPYESSIR